MEEIKKNYLRTLKAEIFQVCISIRSQFKGFFKEKQITNKGC